jgi:hypothetical protein
VVKGSKDIRSGGAESGRVLYALAVQSAQRKKYGGVLGALEYQRLRHFGDRKGRAALGGRERGRGEGGREREREGESLPNRF